ncbi:hypothetical protein [Paraburkholderia silvatlantica]|uniref:Uncharacterized protein n=1 Tax=Paraburkholderia silvatlantica TaxID=321895 RepID=A0A2U1ABJ7_9BURK|nr:hypothetical protein [Paraburkholderia silvatlantica]MBB2930327.1 hypothetical protein [Paraburkholderia silvatlantica]PVY32157.1 hypothetical protein C7411_110120 [Paraburkholderia silvatlantica]PXW37777.1 hypothetical protein C7413_110120 [Paraburkholderia silvatlantica]PYE25598.1 hypothetical protein C7410_104178 [Paraburkholderia silvatlantica]TDQ97759.1 hypothetical protein C7412_10787 [Paraburkholderia silvatlantica]
MNEITIKPVSYVILTSKPGQYRTEATGKLTPTEAWDYVYCGRHLATFVIATLYGEARIRVVDESDDLVVNDMPVRFLEKFCDRDTALEALHVLVGKRNSEAQLLRRLDMPAP